MGTIIEKLSIEPELKARTGRKTLWLGKKAARECLNEARTDPSELGLLIYAGIYRDDHIGEPSIASLLQKGIGANPHLYPLESRTFSFDINAGGCGIVRAAEIINGFIQSGKILKGMIITGDAEPVKNLSESFNFRSSASAMILSKTESNDGFMFFNSDSYPEFRDSFRSFISWRAPKGLARGKNILVVEQSPSYLQECIECSINSLNMFFKTSGLMLEDIDLIIPSQSPFGFPDGIKKRLGNKTEVVNIDLEGWGELHTSGPAYALNSILYSPVWKDAGNILLLTVGAGISTAIAWYRKEPG